LITLNNRALFITICLAPTFTLGDLPETVIDKDALNKPCYVNSIVQEDILVYFSKSYTHGFWGLYDSMESTSNLYNQLKKHDGVK
jgi:hypothetical protein